MLSILSKVCKFIDEDTNELLAITFDHECTSHLIEFVEDCDDVLVEYYDEIHYD